MSEDNRGGDARAESLSPERRAEIAKNAADARWEWKRYNDSPDVDREKVWRATRCEECSHRRAIHDVTIDRPSWNGLGIRRKTYHCAAPGCRCSGFIEPESQQASPENLMPPEA